jgi:phosphoribosylglycinamide formyltransferase-1
VVNIAVLVSGGGTNLQALIDAERAQALGAGRLALCISSHANAHALTRAQNHGMKTRVLSPREFADSEAYADALLALLCREQIEVVVLAGFLTILPGRVIAAYRGRILNVHPSLLPAFGGAGYYGLRVHEAALAAGVRVTGATVHLVDETVDGGKILLQKAVRVRKNETPESLQRRVMEQAEWILLPRATARLCDEIERKKEREG